MSPCFQDNMKKVNSKHWSDRSGHYPFSCSFDFFSPLLLHWSFPDLKVVALKLKKKHSYDRTASAVQLDGARLVLPLINVVPLTLVIK